MSETQYLEQCLSEGEAAAVLGVSRVTLLRLRQRRAIPFLRISNGRALYTPTILRDYMASVRVERVAA